MPEIVWFTVLPFIFELYVPDVVGSAVNLESRLLYLSIRNVSNSYYIPSPGTPFRRQLTTQNARAADQ